MNIEDPLTGKRILLIISGGIAAYKSLDLIRRLRGGHNTEIRSILTDGGQKFITPMAVAAISENEVFTELWSLKNETEMGHIRLSRENDLILVAPASANLMAKMAAGLADDLASTCLLASDKPVMIAPAMNPAMWAHPATQANCATLRSRGVGVIGPASGDTACGESGWGRMCEPEDIVASLTGFLAFPDAPLRGRTALVTSGPTHEQIDPVRFLGNRSSGRQGHAIAQALAQAGAHTVLVTGPTSLPDPQDVETRHVESAAEMLEASETALPRDIAVCAAAVADWRVESLSATKLKKSHFTKPPTFTLTENPDILAQISQNRPQRPSLVIGFAAETPENMELKDIAADKLVRKGCDWILANDIGTGAVFGGSSNRVMLVRGNGPVDEWPEMAKDGVARRLVNEIAGHFRESA